MQFGMIILTVAVIGAAIVIGFLIWAGSKDGAAEKRKTMDPAKTANPVGGPGRDPRLSSREKME